MVVYILKQQFTIELIHLSFYFAKTNGLFPGKQKITGVVFRQIGQHFFENIPLRNFRIGICLVRILKVFFKQILFKIHSLHPAGPMRKLNSSQNGKYFCFFIMPLSIN
jgi:hypothetical protein